MIQLTVYSKPGCHLCEDMKQVVGRVVAELPAGMAVVNEIDISTDAALEQQHGHEVPVLFIDGRKAAKYRITEHELKTRLKR